MSLLQRFQRRRHVTSGPPPGVSQPYAITHSSSGGGAYGLLDGMMFGNTRIGGSDHNWEQEVGDLTLNYCVAGCLRWLADNISEPKLVVERRDADGKWKPDVYHPVIDLLETPNEDYDGDSLVTAAAWDYSLTGRSYLPKERDNLGRLKQLWWVPWYTMAPRYPQDGSAFISDYVYRPAGLGRDYYYAKEDVVHFRWGLDYATGGRLGVHRTRPFLPAISALNEGAIYTPSILRNMGIVPNVLAVRGTVSPAAREGLKAWFSSLFTRDGRGKPGILEVEGGDGAVADLKQLGLSPEDLTLDVILNRPEILVCNAFGIHPGVLYLGGAGGKGFDNGGQLAEARRASYHDCLMPLLKRFATFLTRSVLSEFEIDGPNKVRLRFDFDEVEALQEDRDRLFKRNSEGVKAGWLKVSDARAHAKLDTDETDNVYLRQSGVTAVKTADENVAAPADPLSGTEPDADEEREDGDGDEPLTDEEKEDADD